MKTTAPAIHRGDLLLGFVDGNAVYLTPRDRSVHLLIVGGSGTGKTTTLECLSRQDIVNRRGLCVIDPMGALYQRLLMFFCHRKAIGFPVLEPVLLNAAQPEWVLPYNPFLRRDGDVAVQVDRRVGATLRVWGQQSGDQTPRLEKWLTIIFHALIECDLTIVDAGDLFDQHADQLRNYLTAGLQQPLIRSKLARLGQYRPSEFLEQTESIENRLMRFVISGQIRRMMGIGKNALHFDEMMETGQCLLANLSVSNHLSRSQRRLIGSLILNEFFEAALMRKSGSRPYYLYVDEAAEFVSPEMGDALETCRQKGLHLILSFQHLSQFRTPGDDRLYKAVKNNARNKLVFAVPDREDAQELADDLFVGLAEPKLKLMRRHLSHLIEDVRQTSTTESSGTNRSNGQNWSMSAALSASDSIGFGKGKTQAESTDTSVSRSRTYSSGTNQQHAHGTSRTRMKSESHSWGYADTEGESDTESNSTTQSNGTSHSTMETTGTSAAISAAEDGTGPVRVVNSETESYGSSNLYSSGEAETTGRAHTTSWARTHSGSETVGQSVGKTRSHSSSQGRNQSVSFSRSRQQGSGSSESRSMSMERSHAESATSTQGLGQSEQEGRTRSSSVTNQPGTLHHPFWEEDPEHWTLEEQRWRAAELIMGQPLGHCVARTVSGTLGLASMPLPKKVYLLPSVFERMKRQFYERHNLAFKEAEDLITERQQKLFGPSSGPAQNALNGLPALEATSKSAVPLAAAGELPATQSSSIWNRTSGDGNSNSTGPGKLVGRQRRRGPKPDLENHAKVAAIIGRYGEAWTTDENLREICELLDQQGVPIPKPWPLRPDGKSRSWRRGLENYPELVRKAIRDRLEGFGQKA